MWGFVLFLASGTWCSVSTFDIPSEWVRTHSCNDFQREPLVPSEFVDRVILSDARTRLVCSLSQYEAHVMFSGRNKYRANLTLPEK